MNFLRYKHKIWKLKLILTNLEANIPNGKSSMDNINDQIIISELRKGNKDVFQAVFHQYYPMLAGFAHRYIYEEDVCEDLIQDVFATLWEKRNDHEIGTLKSYLFTAVKNKCLGYLRHLNVRDKHEVFLIEAYFESSGESLIHSELVDKIKEVLSEMPDNMRFIFEQKYLNGLTAVEIAEDLDVSTNTINTQLKRAKKKIRMELLKSGIRVLFLLGV